LTWDLEFGPSFEKLHALRDAGKEVPALDRRPDLPVTLEWVWAAYAEFSRGRNWTMGAPQPVALTEILAYSEIKQLSREEVEELLGYVRELDEVYFEHLKEKQKRDAGARGSNRRTRGRKGR